jgi:biopolymer transport protein ExbB/TolQ
MNAATQRAATSTLQGSGRTYLIAVGAAALVILMGTFVLPKDSTAAVFLFDHSTKSFFSSIYPFTIQNVMYLMVAVGLADLWVRYSATRREEHYLTEELLPEEDTAILQIDDLGPIRRKVTELKASEASFLPQLIDLSILQLLTSHSVEQTVNIFTSTLELMSHRLDLAYQTMRFLVWVIPTTGFIGTVVGIAISLEGMQDPKAINFEKVTSGLAIAFYTTILALVLSAILVLMQNLIQRREETALNRAAQYCLRNLINRIYTGK